MLHKSIFHVIGLMSGSSLDGLDICLVEFNVENSLPVNSFSYKIITAECIEYNTNFRERLREAPQLSAFEFAKLHTELGANFGRLTADFIEKNEIKSLDFIVSHGQTIFHQPKLGFTSQIGCGAQIAAQTKCKVICDLRSSDIAHGGQGAPIVPIAEKHLFPNYSTFLNLGGIANISFHKKENEIYAYDVCAANTMLNYFAQQLHLNYDEDGKIARKGNIIPSLLNELNQIHFCQLSSPKSLGTEHVFQNWIACIKKYNNTIEDKMATAVEHIAIQINQAIHTHKTENHSTILVTGGGAYNTFLMERIQLHSNLKIVIPDLYTIQYKEALAMAFIGLLRYLEIPNSLASVTGAQKDTIGGAIYLP